MPEADSARRRRDVPFLTIISTIALVIATYLTWLFLKRTWDILELILVAMFFALALNPAVDLVERKAHMRRGLATTIVFLAGIAVLAGMVSLFIQPLIVQTQEFIDRLPSLLKDIQNGKGPIGRLVLRYDVDLQRWVKENQTELQNSLRSSTGYVTSVVGTVGRTVFSLVTVLVLSFLMLLEGPKLVAAPLIFFDAETQLRIRKVAADAASSVTGYMAGNLLISLIAGTVTFVTLSLLGVPFAIVLAVWVAFADLIPLVGATLGAVVTIPLAALHSPRAGIIALIVYVVYQQIENHLLQTAIMSKTVRLNPLAVLVSVLIGAKLAGLLGALFAIPVAGVIQVVARDIFDHRNVRLKGEPTVGEERKPVSQQAAEDRDAGPVSNKEDARDN